MISIIARPRDDDTFETHNTRIGHSLDICTISFNALHIGLLSREINAFDTYIYYISKTVKGFG